MTLRAAECAKGMRDGVDDQRHVPWLTKPQGLRAKIGGREEDAVPRMAVIPADELQVWFAGCEAAPYRRPLIAQHCNMLGRRRRRVKRM